MQGELSRTILTQLQTLVVDNLKKISVQDNLPYEDIESLVEMQQHEQNAGILLKKAINAGVPSQKWGVIIGDSFFFRPRNGGEYGWFKVGPIRVLVHEIIRSSGPGHP